jgi:hypothetical protein
MNRFSQFFEDDELIDAYYRKLLHYAVEIQDEMNDNQPRWGGSVVGRKFIKRDRVQGHARLFNDYFSETPVYGDRQFRRRFRMSRPLFLRIVDDVLTHDSYFLQKVDAAKRPGLSPLQKVTAAIRQLAYGTASDSVDEYIQIGESTALACLKHFCKAVVEVYREEYMRTPNEEDVERLLAVGEQRGFPGMLGSIDCMHWAWKNCPTAWHGHFRGKEKEPTFILEAVASRDLWIWHSFFGLPGSLNDINVLDRSPVFSALLNGNTPEVEFHINGNRYNKGYYLADGIYPNYATLVKTISAPQSQKKKVLT